MASALLFQYLMKKLGLRFFLQAAFFISLASSVWADSWDDASNGKHSYLGLGRDFSLTVPVKPIEGARVVLFNEDAARNLGLELPDDPKALERLILDHFAVMIDLGGPAESRKMFATYYLDSGKKAPGEALGDGRALWSSELSRKLPDGRLASIDVVLKGIGQTPLAWTNHNEPTHKDGLQAIQEGVHSFIMSQANARNGMDSTVDLAVIEIPLEKKNKYTGENEKASITVRVGNQTRIAHFAYYSDEPGKFRTLTDYIVNRDLGRPVTDPVGPAEVRAYLSSFAVNIGIESAKYLDLHAVHGSPTLGNRTTNGSTIDMGTFRYLDAHHGNYRYLFKRHSLNEQDRFMKEYIGKILHFMNKAQYEPVRGLSLHGFLEDFERARNAELTTLWLKRLGLTSVQINSLKPSSKKVFFEALWRVMHESNPSRLATVSGQNIHPAQYEIRRILPKLVELSSSDFASAEELKSAVAEVVQTDRPWGENPASAPQVRGGKKWAMKVRAWIARPWMPLSFVPPGGKTEIEDLLRATRHVLRDLNLSPEELGRVSSRAAEYGAKVREVPTDSFFFKGEPEILRAIKSGEDYDFLKESRKALQMAESLVDASGERSRGSPVFESFIRRSGSTVEAESQRSQGPRCGSVFAAGGI